MEAPDFIEVYENAIPNQLCDAIVEVFETQDVLKPIQGSLQVMNVKESGELYRKDSSIALEEVNGAMASEVYSSLNETLLAYIEKYPQLKEMSLRSHGVKIQKTEPTGGYHKFHCEMGGILVTSRVLTWSIYLNDVDEGGETEFIFQAKRLKAIKGNIVIFPAAYTHTHRGNQPISGDKYIATGWYCVY
jgi:hypothetical protein